MTNDDHWIKANQELAKLVVLATLPPVEPDFDFTISYNNIWDTWNNGNLNGICRLVNERRHRMITNEEARKAIEKYQNEHPQNCPYCNEPADVDVTVGYTQIYCPRYSCDMPYMVVHPDKEEAVKAWNKLVEQITQED